MLLTIKVVVEEVVVVVVASAVLSWAAAAAAGPEGSKDTAALHFYIGEAELPRKERIAALEADEVTEGGDLAPVAWRPRRVHRGAGDQGERQVRGHKVVHDPTAQKGGHQDEQAEAVRQGGAGDQDERQVRHPRAVQDHPAQEGRAPRWADLADEESETCVESCEKDVTCEKSCEKDVTCEKSCEKDAEDERLTAELKQEIKEAFNLFDSDGRGIGEKEAFDLFDSDGRGEIDSKELKAPLAAMGAAERLQVAATMGDFISKVAAQETEGARSMPSTRRRGLRRRRRRPASAAIPESLGAVGAEGEPGERGDRMARAAAAPGAASEEEQLAQAALAGGGAPQGEGLAASTAILAHLSTCADGELGGRGERTALTAGSAGAASPAHEDKQSETMDQMDVDTASTGQLATRGEGGVKGCVKFPGTLPPEYGGRHDVAEPEAGVTLESGRGGGATEEGRPGGEAEGRTTLHAGSGSGGSARPAASEGLQFMSEDVRRMVAARSLHVAKQDMRRGDKLGWMRGLARAFAAVSDAPPAVQDGFWQVTVPIRGGGWQSSVHWLGQEVCGEVHRRRAGAAQSAVEHAFAHYVSVMCRTFEALDERRQRAEGGQGEWNGA